MVGAGCRLVSLAAAVGVFAAFALSPAAAHAAPRVVDYCQGRCGDILPPGENGHATVADITANKLLGTHPPHTVDQLAPYANLLFGYQGLSDAQLGQFFDDASFGVPPDQVGSVESPRADVTIVRDRPTGVPHITGSTRSGTEFGAGYAGAEDRLFVMDLLRHLGRGRLSSFAGGAAGNRAEEQSIWRSSPYTEQDLQAQIDRLRQRGARGAQLFQDMQDYLAGVNAYIQSCLLLLTCPGEYTLTGHLEGPQPFTPTDLIAESGVIGGLFGSGGGAELQSALVKLAAEARYGAARGDQVWQAWRAQNDPEATLTLHDGQRFPYGTAPANAPSVAMPDAGTLTPEPVVHDPSGSGTGAAITAAASTGALPGLDVGAPHRGMSNALVVSGRYTTDGHPVAVFGPQTGYFAPQLLMLEELQGPGISARGAAFAGLNLYVQLGRGQDYSWSATSAEQDITDTFAVPLCSPDGSPATLSSTGYVYHGQCLPMEMLEQQDSWSPSPADTTAPGSYKLVTPRTKYGLVIDRGLSNGLPVAFTSLRSTYMHEADSAIGFQMLNDPGAVRSAQDFQQAASNIDYAFNWFYVDSTRTAYYNSGLNPVRAPQSDPNLPIKADPAYEWQSWDPGTFTAAYTPFAAHPNSIDQDYYVSWNNKQALGYSAADGNFSFGSVQRVELLDSRVKSAIQSGQKLDRAALTRIMEDAANVDLRGEALAGELLQVIQSQPVTDPALAAVVQEIQRWQQAGSHRLAPDSATRTYVDAHAIQVVDAWWPLLAQAEFQPGLGQDLYTALVNAIQLNESPSGGQQGSTGSGASLNQSQAHKGSSFQFGWWGYVDKDVRAILGRPVQAGFPVLYCGGGTVPGCRQVLLSALAQAAAEPASQVYPGDSTCAAGDQWCADSIVHSPLGGITDPVIEWQNRPTYQQVVSFPSHR
jgi:acyl-homoserine lactone acylase PvdQ